ncbi:hypothetical protein NEOLEDRAFT_1245545 [Neolentinus lepideus HHB14362 ss-1]|uniref:F-box domain-containing protein n=1 Tax=Neolentinus lepideus HHB14362 ss-1 TaxID=1314782 RepID=A0A165NQ86_9AGAM|nr:hypothetical protein NEOLEDRAFT_1245545 [Neolentinus lepideus HHB14362 ss-1]
MSLLPVELWYDVITHLSKTDLRSCLGVSRIFHDIALKQTFSSITLYFGGMYLLHTLRPRFVLEKNSEAVEYDEKLYETTLDILVRLSEDVQFAAVVQSITIVWERSSMSFQYIDKSTMSSLLKALVNLPHLKAFHWYGDWPDLEEADDLPNKLSLLCQSLVSLRLPRSADVLIRSSGRSLKLGQLKNLRSMTCYEHPDVDCSRHEADNPGNVDFQEIMYNNESSLDSVEVDARAFMESTPAFSRLTFLHVQNTTDDLLPRLGLVLREVPSLQSLSLHTGDAQPDGAFALLQGHSSDMPQLNSLRISSHGWVNAERSAPFIDALQQLKSLRRLDLDFVFDDDPTIILSPILHRRSPIEVLGLNLERAAPRSTSSMTWTYEQCERLSDCLPDSLLALRITSTFERVDCYTMPLLDRLGQLSSLRFLYIANEGGFHPFLATDLAADYASLATIGVNDRIWDVSRVDGIAKLHHWADPQILIRPKEMFASEDDHWLISHCCISQYTCS